MKKVVLFGLFIMAFFSVISLYVNAEVPRLINYQGRLTDIEGQPLEGSYQITFKIYDVESGGSPLWEETQNVNIDKGIFSVMLGGVTNLNLPFDEQYYLEIKVGDEVMIPRKRLTSAGYAMRAKIAEDVVSIPRGVIVLWSGAIISIPGGWALCDGTGGTPDLRDKFIVGARQDDGGVAKTKVKGIFQKTGGEPVHTLAIDEIPSHNHSVGIVDSKCQGIFGLTGVDELNVYWNVTTGSTGGGQSHENCPPFYALAYIMKL